MKRSILNLSLAISLLIMAGCSPAFQVFTDYDPEYDLLNYKTFNWAQASQEGAARNPLYYSDLNERRVKSAVQQQLTARGYILSSDTPDLRLHYHIVVDEGTAISPERFGFLCDPYWMCMQTDIYQYKKGTLILDLNDAKTGNLIWRSWAVSVIDIENSPEQIERMLGGAVEKIFKSFPKAAVHVNPNEELIF